MKKSLVVLMAVAALVCSQAVFAKTTALSSDMLDSVSAGSGVIDWFLGSGVGGVQATDPTATATAAGAGGSAAAADSQSFAGAVADRDGMALNGAGNVGVDVKIDVPISNSFNQNIAAGFGSAAIYGDGNHTVIDNSYVDGYIGFGSYGVIAREATVSNSFNTKETFIDIDLDINNSFNVTNKSMDISGQNGLTAILNANATGDLQAGACLNVTNASASVPTLQAGAGLSIPVISGNAIAVTVLRQVVINNSIIAQGTLQF